MKLIDTLNSIKDLKQLEAIGVEIEFDPQEEDLDIRGQFDDEETVNYVIEKANSGNLAAWFCAHVIVKYRDFEADDYLGGCSYNSFKEFTTADKDYYLDMINNCIEQINKDIKNHNWHIQKWFDIRTAKNLVRPYGLIITNPVREVSQL